MTKRKFNIDLNDNTLITRVFKIVLGVFCILAAIYFVLNITGTAASTITAWIATIFLSLFGLWMIFSGSGLAEKYIEFEGESISLRLNPFASPVILRSSDLLLVEFSPLKICFVFRKGDKINLRLGTYNKERTVLIMSETERFCIDNKVSIKGLESKSTTETE